MWPFRRQKGLRHPLLRRGLRALARGRWQLAAELLAECLATHPEWAEVRVNLGIAYYRLGRFGDALAEFEKAVRQAPHLAEAWLNLAAAANELGLLQRAAEALAEAGKLNPHLRSLHHNLALLRLKEGKIAEALAELETELAWHPDNQAARLLAAALEGRLSLH
jgi:tetratricopeptide (TPR) repeat protein